MKRICIAITVVTAFICIGNMASCNKKEMLITDNIAFKEKLSAYGIYSGVPGSLAHTGSFKLYDLSTPLFSDYAEKQRLIKVPEGQRIIPVGDELPDFPDSTIIVKTFYYYNNKADTAAGKKIIETRLLIKHRGKWNAATYMWNKEQTDALLITGGTDLPINWIDESGKPQVISYHIPGKVECGMCHRNEKDITPIGVKVRNLNHEIKYNGTTINQLLHLHDERIFGPVVPTSYSQLPDWKNTSFSLAQRARSYLDVNCGHCHNDNGFASSSSLKLTFPTSFDGSKIKEKKKAIDVLMSRGAMPLIGTTLVDKEGLELIEEYLRSL